jgi:hypothetical protein
MKRILPSVSLPFTLAALCLGLSTCCRTTGTLGSSSGEPQVEPSTGVTSSSPSQATVDFGIVPVGQTRTIAFSLANTGVASLTITHIVVTTADPEFTLDLAEGTQVVSGTPISVPAHFTPFSGGEKTAVFTLQTDSSDVPSVTLTLQGQGVKLDVQVVPEALNFGQVVIHTQDMLPITLTNSSAAPVTVTLSAVQGTDATLFTLGTLASATLAAGQVETLAVTYAPVQVTAAPSTAFFTITECQGCTSLPINLIGQPVDTGLSITPNPLDFSFLPVGGSVTKTILLANVANRTIHMTTAPTLDTGHPAAAFALGASAPAFPLILTAGQSQSVPVVFTPPALGGYTGSLTFYSDDPQASQVAVPLDGTGGGPQIQCLPSSVAFGQVAVGAPVTQQVLCTNVGQDVPGNPAATLQLGSLTVPNGPAFTAHYDSAPPAAGLSSGQSLLIDVIYTPPMAEQDSASLNIASNDGQTPVLVVPLTGTAISLPPCDSVVAPSGGLVFGEVQAGHTLQLPFAIANQGNSDCLVNGLNLSSTTNASFTLPNGPIASQVLGYAGNPQGAPTSLTVPVQFAPTQAGTFAGAVSFTISNPTNPQVSVPLSGQSGPSCLVISPATIDFGTVNVNPATSSWCASLKRNVQLINTCNTDLSATAITIGTGTGTTPEFVLSGLPQLPAAIPAGSSVPFQVAFQPNGQGEWYGTVAVTLANVPPGPYLVPLQGNAQPDGQETDTFNVTTSQPQVDLLWVIDNDDDFSQDQLIAQNLPAFFQAAQAANVDFQMAVTDTDTCGAPGADDGWFEPCQSCQFTTSAAAQIITSQDANPVAELSALIQMNMYNCSSAPQDEQIFEGPYLALQPSLLAGHNAGFLRPNAYLAILAIDGDSEDDLSPSSVQSYYDFFESVKGDPTLFSFSYVNQGLSQIPGNQQSRVSTLVTLTGGVEADTTTGTWATDLNALWASTSAAAYRYPLTGTPVATSITLTLDGVNYPATGSHGNPQWSYDPTTNAVVFVPIAAPQAGDTVAITYTVACG